MGELTATQRLTGSGQHLVSPLRVHEESDCHSRVGLPLALRSQGPRTVSLHPDVQIGGLRPCPRHDPPPFEDAGEVAGAPIYVRVRSSLARQPLEPRHDARENPALK